MRVHLGGIEGNEILTSATALLLTVLLLAEGITIVDMGGLLSAHMFIGLVLIPPVLLKLGSTGYRFFRYYTGARPYREKGPPALPMRLLAPALVVTTVGIFATGILLLLSGHKSDQLLFIHKVFFFVWGAVFAVHFLAYIPRVLGTLGEGWRASRREKTPGGGLRDTMLAATVGGGVALALALSPTVSAWHGGA
jgi:hypothetical protein